MLSNKSQQWNLWEFDGLPTIPWACTRYLFYNEQISIEYINNKQGEPENPKANR